MSLGLTVHPSVTARLRRRRRTGALLLLVQLWVACALPLLHASQERLEQRAPVLGEAGSLARATHGAACAVCALTVAPALPAASGTSSSLTGYRPQAHYHFELDHPFHRLNRPLGPRAPPSPDLI